MPRAAASRPDSERSQARSFAEETKPHSTRTAGQRASRRTIHRASLRPRSSVADPAARTSRRWTHSASFAFPRSFAFPGKRIFDSALEGPRWTVDSMPCGVRRYVSIPRADPPSAELRWTLTKASARQRRAASARSASSTAVASSVRVSMTSNPSSRSLRAARFAMSSEMLFSSVFPSLDTAPESIPPCPGSRHTRYFRAGGGGAGWTTGAGGGASARGAAGAAGAAGTGAAGTEAAGTSASASSGQISGTSSGTVAQPASATNASSGSLEARMRDISENGKPPEPLRLRGRRWLRWLDSNQRPRD